MATLGTCLWFDSDAEEAARFYTSVFPGSKVGDITRTPEAASEVSGRPAGSVLAVEFEILGRPFMALNGGPTFKFTEAVSIVIDCKDQDEVDHYWDRLSEGGDPSAQQCGWLKDRFGLSWQVVPAELNAMMKDSDPAKVERVTAAFLPMKKLDLEELRRAFAGDAA
jgi:predicted 3-demethylubiquinone-9 3-methyltransferase (glyoxalase superfamily)